MSICSTPSSAGLELRASAVGHVRVLEVRDLQVGPGLAIIITIIIIIIIIKELVLKI